MSLHELLKQRAPGQCLTLNEKIMLVLELGLKDDGSGFYTNEEKALLLEELLEWYTT